MKAELTAGSPSESSEFWRCFLWMPFEVCIQFMEMNSIAHLEHQTFLTAYIILEKKKSLKTMTLYNPPNHFQSRSAVFTLRMMTLTYRKVKELDQSHVVTVTQHDSIRLQLRFIWLESKSFSSHTHAVFPLPSPTAQEGWPSRKELLTFFSLLQATSTWGNLRAHPQSWAWWQALAIPMQGKQRQVDL